MRLMRLVHLLLMLSLLRARVLSLSELLRRAHELRRRGGELRRIPSSRADVRRA